MDFHDSAGAHDDTARPHLARPAFTFLRLLLRTQLGVYGSFVFVNNPLATVSRLAAPIRRKSPSSSSGMPFIENGRAPVRVQSNNLSRAGRRRRRPAERFSSDRYMRAYPQGNSEVSEPLLESRSYYIILCVFCGVQADKIHVRLERKLNNNGKKKKE